MVINLRTCYTLYDTFYDFDLSLLGFEHPTFRLHGKRFNALRQNHFKPKILLQYEQNKYTAYSRELVRRHIHVWNVKEEFWENIRCTVAMEHAVFQIKYEKYCKTKWMKHSLSIKNMISNLTKYQISFLLCSMHSTAVLSAYFFNDPHKYYYYKRSKSSFDDFSEMHTPCEPLTNNPNQINLSKGIKTTSIGKLMVFIGLGIYRILDLKDIGSRIIPYINQIRFN